MDSVMSITDFSVLITSEQDGNPWVEALRKLTKIERVEDVRSILDQAAGPMATWTGWAF